MALAIRASAEHGISALVTRWRWVLAGLVVLHWACLGVFALSVPHNGWLFYQGGDQIWLTASGWVLAQGELPPAYVGYGWSLLLAPITAIVGPSFVSALPAVAVLSAAILAPLAIWAVFELAQLVAGRAFALFASCCWVVLPYAVIPLWRNDYHERYVEQFLPQALGFSALADYVSTVLLLVAAALLARTLASGAARDAIAAGAVAGFAIGTKPANVLFLLGPALAFGAARRGRLGTIYAAALGPAVLTLALWKARGLGELPLFALDRHHLAASAASLPSVDRYVNVDWRALDANMDSLREYFWSARFLQWLPFAGTFAVARRSVPLAALLAGWFFAFLVVKGATPLASVESGSFLRYLMPSYGAYFLLGVSALLLVPTLAQRLSVRWPAGEVRALDRRVVATLVAALALVPLTVVAVARPAQDIRTLFVANILTPVDERISISVERDGESRTLTWSQPPVGSARVFYRVYRTEAGIGGLDCRPDAGARDCTLRMIVLGTTREPRWRDGSPPPGAEYRIGIAANWVDDPAQGDVFLISRAIPRDP